MRKTINQLIICGISLFFIAVFASGDVMAFSDEPCSKTNYEYCSEPAMSAQNGLWQITLNEIVPAAAEGRWEWRYTIQSAPDGRFTGSNFVGFLLPDCCRTADPDERIVIDETGSSPGITCFDVSEGETVLNFGRYNNQAFVCKGTPDSTGNWTIIANTPFKTRSTIIIKSGKDVIEFEMAVPGCPPAPTPTEPLIGARTFSECSNFGQDTLEPYEVDGVLVPAENDDVSFYVIRSDDRDGCVSTIWRCEGLDCPSCTTAAGCTTGGDAPCELVDPEALPPNIVTETSFLRTCPDENVTVGTGSPYYKYVISSGGVTYKSCLDLGTGRWVSYSYCQ